MNQLFKIVDIICKKSPLLFCYKFSESEMYNGPECYSLNGYIFNRIVFQPVSLLLYIISIIMVLWVIVLIVKVYISVNDKYLYFYVFYLISVILEFILYSGLIPYTNIAFDVLLCFYYSLVSIIFYLLFYFSLFSPISIKKSKFKFLFNILFIFNVTMLITVTFYILKKKNDFLKLALLIVVYLMNVLYLLASFILEIIDIISTINYQNDNLYYLFLSLILFILSNSSLIFFNNYICKFMNRYTDSLFINVHLNLLVVYSLFKYWDSFGIKDLEFSTDFLKTWKIELYEE